jgi:predicted outer membrane repeat protein
MLLLVSASLASTLLVSPSGPYTTIGSAISAAASGDTISVDAGTWAECIDFSGKSLSIVGAGMGVTTLAGGGTCTNAVAVQGGESASLSALTVTNTGRRAIYVDSSDLELDAVEVADAGSSTSSGGGVHVTGGTLAVVDSTFRGLLGGYGAALYGYLATVSIEGSSFADNAASYAGGALYAWDSGTVTVSNSTFEGNTSTSGGAFSVTGSGSALDVSDSSFTANLASYSGGAIVMESGTSFTLTRSEFQSNVSAQYGGAVYAQLVRSATLDGSTFEANESGRGGGLYILGTSSAYTTSITDSRFEGNVATLGSAGALDLSTSAVSLSRSTFVGNEGIQGGALSASQNAPFSASANLFCGNLSTGDGGAVYMGNSTAETWSNNLFVDNVSGDRGGALASTSSNLYFRNNTVVGNGATRSGSAVGLWNTTSVDLRNNLFAEGFDGAAVYIHRASAASFTTLAYDGWYGNVDGNAGGYLTLDTTTSGHVSADPLLESYTDDGDCDNDSLALQVGSPLFDAGDPAYADPDGSRADIGAYGGSGASEWDDDGDGVFRPADCDDEDPLMGARATSESCNGLDDDCDGEIDEATASGTRR